MDFRQIKKRRIVESSTVRHFFKHPQLSIKSDALPAATVDIARAACRIYIICQYFGC